MLSNIGVFKLLEKIVGFIEKVGKDVVCSEKEFAEMSVGNKQTIKDAKERIKAKQEKFDKKRANKKF